ncbi:MAG: YdbL family protein [Alphaproteobacteria bacterium]|nr:YdbL family protein [Alphaproteobacteria bacterium]
MKPRFLTVLLLLCSLMVLPALPAYAMDLHEARGAGLVGEKPDGYVAAVKPSPEVQSLVAEVNAKRRQEYARISKQNGQPADVVAKLAAQQVINGLPAGSLYQGPDGSWKKR